MKEKLIKLKELFEKCKGLDRESTEEITQTALQIFEYILYKMKSGNTEEKNEALILSQELKKLLEEQASLALKELNMTPEQLQSFMNNNMNFSKDEWEALENAKTTVNNYEENLGLIHKEKPHNKINKKAWIAS
jgi:hypothetical protein